MSGHRPELWWYAAPCIFGATIERWPYLTSYTFKGVGTCISELQREPSWLFPHAKPSYVNHNPNSSSALSHKIGIFFSSYWNMASVSQDTELFVPNNTSDFVYISLTERIKTLEWKFFLHQLFTPFSSVKRFQVCLLMTKSALFMFSRWLIPVRCQ